MFEWWQTVILSLSTLALGSVTAVVTAYLQRRWSKSDALQSQERESKRRAEEQQRQKKWERREQRIKGIEDFLETAKLYCARAAIERVFTDQADHVSEPSRLDVARQAAIAYATAITPQIQSSVVEMLRAVAKTRNEQLAEEERREAEGEARRLIRITEQQLEGYVTEI